MIHLTRLNNSSLIVNSDLIKFIEESPDTVITLLNGEKLVVREGAEQIRGQIIEFRRAVLAAQPAAADPELGTLPGPQPAAGESTERRR